MSAVEVGSSTIFNGERPLPPGWRRVCLGEVSTVNPPRPIGVRRAEKCPTTFVPMAAVDERVGAVERAEVRPYAEVRKGYTYFAEGDVLFAKITPCMQNGKHAIATGLIDGVGFGSTEFHVLRPSAAITSEWIHLFLRQPSVLRAATAHFTGAVGQQRVPESFLVNLEIPVPPLSEQKRITVLLTKQMAAVERARVATMAQLEAAKGLTAAVLRAAFTDHRSPQFGIALLGDLLELRKEVVHPKHGPTGPARFVGLEHIESGTGRRIGELPVEMSSLTGRKPRFYKGDIVYGYLRPYLNKVWVAEFDGLCSVDQYVYSVKADKADRDYIAHFLRSPVYLVRAPIDTTPGQLPRIRTEEVASVQVPLPPLRDQKRIASYLSGWLARVEHLRQALEVQLTNINKLPSSLLARAFAGGI